ncbi:hypothetical protein GCM10010517_19300 [Streptosporangium fragile]|uniref:Uncharacterized protein n=1 Tax=Streptosporangium fragile TaxID=46186 RepID=A0ABN3VUA3_9ACTN
MHAADGTTLVTGPIPELPPEDVPMRAFVHAWTGSPARSQPGGTDTYVRPGLGRPAALPGGATLPRPRPPSGGERVIVRGTAARRPSWWVDEVHDPWPAGDPEERRARSRAR